MDENFPFYPLPAYLLPGILGEPDVLLWLFGSLTFLALQMLQAGLTFNFHERLLLAR